MPDLNPNQFSGYESSEDQVIEGIERRGSAAEARARGRASGKERAQNRAAKSLSRVYEDTPFGSEDEQHRFSVGSGFIPKTEFKRMNQSRKATGKTPLPTYYPRKK